MGKAWTATGALSGLAAITRAHQRLQETQERFRLLVQEVRDYAII